MIVDLPGDRTLEVDTWGNREHPPLLLLRPLGGGKRAWHELASSLLHERFVVCPEFRGRSQSSPLPLLSTTHTLADDIIALLDRWSLAIVDLFGLSLGGMVAMHVAAQTPERVERLVLASTTAFGRRLTRTSIKTLATMSRCLLASTPEAEACLVGQVLQDADESFAAEEREYARTHALHLLKEVTPDPPNRPADRPDNLSVRTITHRPVQDTPSMNTTKPSVQVLCLCPIARPFVVVSQSRVMNRRDRSTSPQRVSSAPPRKTALNRLTRNHDFGTCQMWMFDVFAGPTRWPLSEC